MKLRLPDTPARFTLVALLGGLITGTPFLLLLVIRTYHLRTIPPLLWVPVEIGLIGAGFFLGLRAESNLRNGIAAERWTAFQLAPIRKIFGSRYIITVAVGLIAVGVILLLMNSRQTGVMWPFILLSQSLTRIFDALKEPRPSTPPPDWRNFTPIHSDQWGHR